MALRSLAHLALALCATSAPGTEGQMDARSRVADELQALSSGAEPSAVGARLAALPEPAAPVFDALGAESLVLDGTTLVLGEREHAALVEAARAIGRGPFVSLWNAAVAGTDSAHRRAAIELVGLLGTGVDATIAIAAASPHDAHTPTDARALELLEEATGRLIARAPDALVGLRPPLLEAPPEIAGRIVRAVGAHADPRGIEFLVELLAFDEDLDLPLLSAIECAASSGTPPFPERVRSRVRGYLGSMDRQLARTAAMALAALEDEDSVPTLVDLCDTQDAALAGACFRALERTTGLALPRRATVWQVWLVHEQTWTNTEGRGVVTALQGDNPTRIIAALREAAPHRLERQRLSLLAARHLANENPRVRMEVCRTLQALDSSVARRALRRAADDPDPAVAALAAEALGAPADAAESTKVARP